MRNGLPPALDKVRANAAIRKRADALLTEAIDEAIAAGISPADVEHTIHECETWPPPLAVQEFKDGWFAAQDRQKVPQNGADDQTFAGFEAFVMRKGRG